MVSCGWSDVSGEYFSKRSFGWVPKLQGSGPLSTKRKDVLPQDLVKSRIREIVCYNDRIVLKFDRHLGSAAAKVPVIFQSDWKYLNINLGLRCFTRSWGKTSVRLVNRGPALSEILGKIWLACDCATRHSDVRLINVCCSTTIIGHMYNYSWLSWRYIWSLLTSFDACETLHTESKFYIII